MSRERPHDDRTEQNLLGCVLLWPDACAAQLARVRPEDFYAPRHAVLCAAMQAIRQREGASLDAASLWAELQRMERAQTVSWEAVSCLTDFATTTVAAPALCDRVLDLAQLRRLADLLDEARADVQAAGATAAGVSGEVLRAVMALGATRATRRSQPLSAMIDAYEADLGARAQGKGGPQWRTGLAGLDAVLRPMRPGQVIVLAARPNTGKTAMLLQIATHTARAGAQVQVFSLETMNHDLVERMLSAASLVPNDRLGDPRGLSADDQEAFAVGAEALYRLPIESDDGFEATPEDILMVCTDRKARTGLDVVLIDYTQLVDAVLGKGATREQAIAHISRSFKKLAKRLGVVVVALAQLNREVEKGNRKPIMSDLRESGQLEQDADAILMLHSETPNADEIDVLVVKQRKGPKGEARVRFDRAFTAFRDVEGTPDPIEEPSPAGAREWRGSEPEETDAPF